MKRIVFLLLLLGLFINTGAIRPASAQDVRAEWAKFQAKYGRHLQATWNERTGRPQDILGFIEPKEILVQLGLAAIQDKESANLLWKAFLDVNEPLFGVNSSDFPFSEVREITTSRWGRLYKVKRQQAHQGVLVEGTKAIMFVDSQGRILSFSLLAEPDIQISAVPSVTQARALSIARSEVQKGQEAEATAELRVLVNEASDTGPHTLAWQVLVEKETAVIIDAHKGVVLKTYPWGDPYVNSGDVEFHYYTDPPGQNGEPLPETSVTNNMIVKIFTSGGGLVAQQTVYSSSPRYNISWSGASGVYYLNGYKDGTYVNVQLNVAFIPQSSYEYDIGSPKDASLQGGITSRDTLNTYYQCDQMHAIFNAIDPSYNKSKVNVDLIDEPSGGGWIGLTDSSTHFKLRDVGSYVSDVVRHEYTHTVIWDIYGSGGVGSSHEADTMDEAFATFYAARSFSDFYYGDPNGPPHDLEDPQSVWSYGAREPYLYSQHDKTKDVHWNQMILASTLWDLIQSSNPNSPPLSVPHPAGWDTIIWLAVNDEKSTHHEFRDRVVYWAGAWGGSSYANFAAGIFNEHGIPSGSGSWAPPLHPFYLETASLSSEMPSKPNYRFALLQNYPSPFNPETWIPYTLERDVEVTIQIHDAAGRLVRTLSLGRKPAGEYLSKERAAYWDGRNEAGEKVSSGIYYYRMTAGNFSSTRKMMLLK
ncbi:hypothetical protein HYR99_31600 [Candidatus Poribacteria bacterium]|nr:hypothetical protein [Candidatus Poribacteria bacterium]